MILKEVGPDFNSRLVPWRPRRSPAGRQGRL